jgi:hypothetical protein
VRTGQVSPSHERMLVALEELADLKGVWSELARIWEQIDELKEKPWLSVAPRKVGAKFICKRISQTDLKKVLYVKKKYIQQNYKKKKTHESKFLSAKTFFRKLIMEQN